MWLVVVEATMGLMFLHCSTSGSRPECQQTCTDPSKCDTVFLFNRQGIKEPTLRSQSQLHNIFCCPSSLSLCLSSHPLGEGQWILFFSIPRPLCLISVIQLMRLGLWQAAGTHTKGSSTEMCS